MVEIPTLNSFAAFVSLIGFCSKAILIFVLACFCPFQNKGVNIKQLFKLRSQYTNNLIDGFFFQIRTINKVTNFKVEHTFCRIATDIL